MTRLIEAFEGLFTAAAESDGETAETGKFILENVNWMGKLNKPEPVSHSTLDSHLEAACAQSGQLGSSAQLVAKALLAVGDRLTWRTPSTDRESEPDMAVFSRNYSSTPVIGEGGLLPSDKVAAGLSLQGTDTYYPPHANRDVESYWIIGANGDWSVGVEPLAAYLDKAKDRRNTNIMGNWHPYNRIDPDQPQTRLPFLAGNQGGVNTQDDDDLYGYDAEYGMGGDACIHNMARNVAVAPRNVSTSLRYLPFES